MAYRLGAAPPPYALAPTLPVQSLLGQVLGLSAIGLVITGVAAYSLSGTIGFGVGLIAMLAGFVLLIAINATRANEGLSLLLFYAFTFLEGVGIAPTIGYYLQAVGPDVVFQAAMTTGLGMLALGAIVYATGLDLRRFSGYFFLALLGLVVVGVISVFTRWIHPATYSWLVLAIFTGLVLIDFARIRAGGGGFTPVQLAVQIYLDAINIFLAVLQLMAARRSED